MYQFSRAIYRELVEDIELQRTADGHSSHEIVLKACEATMDRLANDRHYFARPARTLFNDIRGFFPLGAQARVWQACARYIAYAEEWLARQPRHGTDAHGNPLQCRATTRRGTPCQREPLPRNGYCPSHQHLAETEGQEALVAA